MIFSLFKKKHDQNEEGDAPSQRFVRPMEPADITHVLELIEEHDEDDANEAGACFDDTLQGMFVAIDDGKIVGVTGADAEPETSDIAWLSWTYVEKSSQRQGIGRYLVNGLIGELKNAGIRKVFISTGDYVEDGEDIYAAAKAFYYDLGARLEMKIDDYYAKGEARYIYGLDIEEPVNVEPPAQSGNLIFDGLEEADESADGVLLSWREYNPQEDSAMDPAQKLTEYLDQARLEKARFIGAAIPFDLSEGAIKGLKKKGFVQVGELKDYYAPGIAQLFWQIITDK
ncbi:MAG: GNAT family N-acetyltransferase [Hyphomicrobiaceae bacterium]|nr:GNAT family N-acetyltransferase [Hyphomicrobiaceae bacterium]